MRPVTLLDLIAALTRMDTPGFPLPQEPNGFLLPGNFPPGWTPPSDNDLPFLRSDDSDDPWETTL